MGGRREKKRAEAGFKGKAPGGRRSASGWIGFRAYDSNWGPIRFNLGPKLGPAPQIGAHTSNWGPHLLLPPLTPSLPPSPPALPCAAPRGSGGGAGLLGLRVWCRCTHPGGRTRGEWRGGGGKGARGGRQGGGAARGRRQEGSSRRRGGATSILSTLVNMRKGDMAPPFSGMGPHTPPQPLTPSLHSNDGEHRSQVQRRGYDLASGFPPHTNPTS